MYKDVGSNSLIAYNVTGTTNATDVTTATLERQMQETKSQSLMITSQLELEIKRNKLGNCRVLKLINRNRVIGKAKVRTQYDVKERSTNMTVLKMIAKQEADEKLQLEN